MASWQQVMPFKSLESKRLSPKSSSVSCSSVLASTSVDEPLNKVNGHEVELRTETNCVELPS